MGAVGVPDRYPLPRVKQELQLTDGSLIIYKWAVGDLRTGY
jgi:hypothetical protein